VAQPDSTFVVDDPGEGVGSTDRINNFLICDRSGFRQTVKKGLQEEWNNVQVREESWEAQNQQDFVGNRAEVLEGSIRPEPAEDTFVEVNEVQPGDF